MTLFEKIIKILTNSKYMGQILSGVGGTVVIALVGTILGLVIGLLIGIIKTIPQAKTTLGKIIQKIYNFILSAYIEVFRGTPMMVQAMIIFYGVFTLINPRIGNDPTGMMLVGITIVSINTGAYMAEIVRGGILSIDKGQFEGAYSIGMSHTKTMLFIIIPQAVKNILPSVTNEFIINIKDTSVLNIIGVTELFFYAQMVAGSSLMQLPTYIISATIYFIMTFTLSRLMLLLEKVLAGKKNYTVFGSQSDPKAEIKVEEV